MERTGRPRQHGWILLGLLGVLAGLLVPPGQARAAGAVPIQDLALWLRADQVATAGGSFAGWLDRSGQGNHALAPDDASSPEVLPTGLGGCPTLFFDGGDHVSVPIDISPAVTPDLTIATVFSSATSTAGYRKVYGHDDLGWDRAAGLDPRLPDHNFGMFTGSGVHGTLTIAADQTVVNIESWTPSGYRIHSNLLEADLSVAVSNGPGLDQLWIGSAGDVTHEHWLGRIAEVLVWDRVLGADEVRDVEAYLVDRYGADGTTASCGDPGAGPAPTDPPDPDGTPTETPDGAAGPQPGDRLLERIGGDSRFATAAGLALGAFDSADTVLVASGRVFADATAASGLAGHLGAPILLTEPTMLPDATRDALDRLSPTRIVVLGGTAAVDEGVAQDLQAYGTVDRLAGDSRIGTAAAMAGEIPTASVGTIAGRRTAVVTTARAFADALAAGPLAYGQVLPVLLTEPDALPAATAAVLQALGIESVLVLGGTAAVGEQVEADLRSLAGDVRRVSGDGRFDTAAALAEIGWTELGRSASGLVLAADGTDFPDALAAGSHAGQLGGVLVLVATDQAPDAARRWTEQHADEIAVIRAVGGTSAVSTNSLDGLAATEPMTVLAGPGVDPTLIGRFDVPPSHGQGLIAAVLVHDDTDDGVVDIDRVEMVDNAGHPIMSATVDDQGRPILVSYAGGIRTRVAYGAEGTEVDFVLPDGTVGAATIERLGASGGFAAEPGADVAPSRSAFQDAEVVQQVFRVRRSAVIDLSVRGSGSPPQLSGAQVARSLQVEVVSCGSIPNAACSVQPFYEGSGVRLIVVHETLVEVGAATAREITDACIPGEGSDLDRAMRDGVAQIFEEIHNVQDGLGWFLPVPKVVGAVTGGLQYTASQMRFAPVIDTCQEFARGEAIQRQLDQIDLPVQVQVALSSPFYDIVPATVQSDTYRPFQRGHLDTAVVGSFDVVPEPAAPPPGRYCSVDGDPVNDRVPYFFPTFDPNRSSLQDLRCGAAPPAELPPGEYLPIIAEGTGTGGNGIYSVRTQSSVESGQLRNCNFRHGGICSSGSGAELADITVLTPPTTVEAATTDVCERFDPGSFGSPPLAAGYVASIGGTYHTVDDWGSLDIGLCGSIVNGSRAGQGPDVSGRRVLSAEQTADVLAGEGAAERAVGQDFRPPGPVLTARDMPGG